MKHPWFDEDGKFQPSSLAHRPSSYVMGRYFLQNYLELSKYIEWLKDKDIRSYVELGVYKGQLLNFMCREFGLSQCWGIDIVHPEQNEAPGFIPYAEKHVKETLEPLDSGIQFIQVSSHTWEYASIRQQIGEVDLVFIDAAHAPEDVFQDLLVEYSLGLTRFIGLHDVGAWYGPKMAWQRIQEDQKLFYTCDDWAGIGVLKGPREGGKLSMKPISHSDWAIEKGSLNVE